MGDIPSDLLATGSLTTIGGPILILFCIFNIFRKDSKKIGWYYLAPLIQSYLIVGGYTLTYGLKIVTNYCETTAFVTLSSAVTSIAFCVIIHLHKPPKKVPREVQFTIGSFIPTFFTPLAVFYGLSVFMISFSIPDETFIHDCLQNFRCRSIARTIGLPGYAGTLLVPALFLGIITTTAYLTIFFTEYAENSNE